MAVPNRIRERMTSGLKRLAPIIAQQRSRDVSEADTVTLVKDFLSEILGFDKYAEVTSEFAIRNTYCDLAIRIDEKVVQLIEVKAVGITLDDRHVKQTIDYGANQGIEWVILTNATVWRLYHIIFGKPIEKQLVAEVDITALDLRRDEDVELLWVLTKEGFSKGAHLALRDRQDATSRYMLAALLVHNESVIAVIRRELRRVVDVLVDEKVVLKVLRDEVIKRDALEGPAAEEASKRINRKAAKVKRASKRADGLDETDPNASEESHALGDDSALNSPPAESDDVAGRN